MAKKYYKKTTRSGSKRYSASERQSWKRGFFAGLFLSKKKKKKTTKSPYRTVSDIPYNYQHNVLFSDERYADLFRSLWRSGRYKQASKEHIDATLREYKKRYGDKVLREHYHIK